MGILEEVLQELKDLKALLMDSKAGETKPETATETPKQKKARLAKEKKAAAGVKGAAEITLASVRKLAKGIAVSVEGNEKECMEQIREVVGTVAESCYDNANIGIDQFDETGLALLDEALRDFVYAAPSDDTEEEKKTGDDLEI